MSNWIRSLKHWQRRYVQVYPFAASRWVQPATSGSGPRPVPMRWRDGVAIKISRRRILMIVRPRG